MARTDPDTPASKVCQDAIKRLYNSCCLRRIDRSQTPPANAPPFRTFIVDSAGTSGFDPTKRQPLPGTRNLWEACLMLQPILIYHRGMNAEK